jgi:hypothetical protein
MNILKFVYSDKVIARWVKAKLPDKLDVVQSVALNSSVIKKETIKYSAAADADCEFYARKFLKTLQHEPETDPAVRLSRVKTIAKAIKRYCKIFAVDLIASKDDSPLGLVNHYDKDQKSSVTLLWTFLHYYCANNEDTNIRRLYFDPQSELVEGNKEKGTARADFDIAVYLLMRVTSLESGLDINALSSLYKKIVKSEYSLELSLWSEGMVDSYLSTICQLFHLAGKFGQKEKFHSAFPEVAIEDLRFKTRYLYLDMTTGDDDIIKKIGDLNFTFSDTPSVKGLLKKQEMYGPVPSWLGFALPDKTKAVASNEVELSHFKSDPGDGARSSDLIIDTKQFSYNDAQNYSRIDNPWIAAFSLIKMMVNPLTMSGSIYLSPDMKVKSQAFGNASEIEWASKIPPAYTGVTSEMQTPIWTSMRNEVTFPVSWDRVNKRIIVQFKSKSFSTFKFVREIKNALPTKITIADGANVLVLEKLKDEGTTSLYYKEAK